MSPQDNFKLRSLTHTQNVHIIEFELRYQNVRKISETAQLKIVSTEIGKKIYYWVLLVYSAPY